LRKNNWLTFHVPYSLTPLGLHGCNNQSHSSLKGIFNYDWSISYSYSLIHTATAHCRRRLIDAVSLKP